MTVISDLRSVRTGFNDVADLLGGLMDIETYTPTYAVNTGGGTWTSITTDTASYIESETYVIFWIQARGTIGSTVTSISATTPTAVTTGTSAGGFIYETGGFPYGGYFDMGADKVVAGRYDRVAMGTGTNAGFSVCGIYIK